MDEIQKIKKSLADLWMEFTGHRHTDIDSLPIDTTNISGDLNNVAIGGTSTVGGVSNATLGYIGTQAADIVPTGLAAISTSVTVASDGTVSANVVLTWTAISSTTFDHYVIRYKKASYTYYTYQNLYTNSVVIDGLVPNTSYNFGIASVNKYGSQSAFSSDISQTTATSTTAPATVTSTSATAGIQYIILEWAHNTDTDLASYNVYRNTVNNSATATLIVNCRTNYFIDGGRTGGQIYYYWIKAVNTSGLVSASFSTVQSATPRNVNSADTNVSNQGWTQTCVFSSTDADTVTWSAGTFTTASGTSYSILTGNTGNMSARTYIYLDIAVSTTAYQTTTTATSAVGDGKVLIGVAQNGTGEATFQIFGGSGGVYLNGADLVTGSVTTNEIAANTIVAGNIASGTITTTQIAADTITSNNINGTIGIAASKILIDGTTYLSNWRAGGDFTKIDGGNIYTGTVTTTALNFTPVQSTNVIASINASAEGITIDADNLTISAATTFSSGYDPTDKVAELGGVYNSAASGARVRIFPDANTGIQVIDDATNDVFKVIVGGTDVGDVIVGNYSGGHGIKYDKSADTTTFTGDIVGSNTIGIKGSFVCGENIGFIARWGDASAQDFITNNGGSSDFQIASYIEFPVINVKYIAQSFKLLANEKVDTVSVQLSFAGASGGSIKPRIKTHIQGDSSGNPDGSDLSSSGYVCFDWQGEGVWTNLNVTSVNLAANTTYWVVLELEESGTPGWWDHTTCGIGGKAGEYFYIHYDNNGTSYADGKMKFKTTEGGSWTDGGYSRDLKFKISGVEDGMKLYAANAATQGSVDRIVGMINNLETTNYGDTVTLLWKKSTYETTGLTAGSVYYLADNGTLSTSAGTIRKVVGIARSTTTFFLDI